MAQKDMSLVGRGLAIVIVISIVLPVGFFSVAPSATGTNQQTIDTNYYVVKTHENSQKQILQRSTVDITHDYGCQVLSELTESQAEMVMNSGFEIEPVETTILFPTVQFDTQTGEPVLAEELTAESDYYIVQFIGPIIQEWKARLEALGAINTEHYWSNHAYIIKMDETTKRQVEALPFINWVSQYQPAYKFANDLSEFETTDMVLVDVFKNEDFYHAVAKMKSLGATVDLLNVKDEYDSQARIEIASSLLPELASIDEISVIAKYVQPHVMCDQAATEYCTAANLAWYKETSGFDVPTNTWGGLTGYGQVVGITDTGFDTGSASSGHYDMFNGPLGDRVVGIHRSGGCSGNTDDHLHAHGTFVTGIVAGNAYCAETHYGMDTSDHIYGGDHVFAGMAPEAKVTINAAGDNTQDGGLCPVTPNCWNIEKSDGARIHTNSWGGGSGYSGSAVDADQFMWSNRDDLIFCAAGNGGPSSSTIGPPASAKNDMTVGASGNYRPAYMYLSDPNLIYKGSSRGPFPTTTPNRYEPDICAPGDYLVSLTATNYQYDLSDADCDGDNYNPDPDYMPEDIYRPGVYQTGLVQTDYVPSLDFFHWTFYGTSAACPAAAGTTALIRQYYTDIEGITPSGILMKATAIHGGIDMGYGFPSNDQGWGRINVKESLFPDAPATVQYYDHRTGIVTGEIWDADSDGGLDTYIQSSRAPLKVTLVTLDTSGNGGRLSNDLDLRVISPSSTLYKGNNFNGAWSESFGTDDDQMLVERVLIEEPEEGPWTIRVSGETTPFGNTPFAIIISGDFGPEKEYEVEMIPEFESIFKCVPGGSTTFRYNLLNFGSQNDTIALSENSLPAGFMVSYTPTSPVYLMSNEGTDVTALIEVDITVSPKSYQFEFKATSQNDTATPPSQDRIEVICEVLDNPLPKLMRITDSLHSEGEPTIRTHNDGSNDYIFITYKKYDENGPHIYLRFSTDYGYSWMERQVSTVDDCPRDLKMVVYSHDSPSYPDRVVILWPGSDPGASSYYDSWVYCAFSDPPYVNWMEQQVIPTDSGTSDAHTGHRRIAAAIYMGGTGNEELIVTVECLGTSYTMDICDVYSTSGGYTWTGWGATKPAATGSPDLFQEMTADQNGDVFMVNYRSQGGAQRREVYLTDYKGAGSWGAQQLVTSLNTAWNDVYPTIWSSDEGTSNNRLYVAKLYSTQDPPMPPLTIYESHSDNTGSTWSTASGPYGTSASKFGFWFGRSLTMGVYTPTDGRNWLTREEEPTGSTGTNPFPVPNIHTQYTSDGFTSSGLFKVTADAIGKDHPTFDSIGGTVYHAFGAQYIPGNKDIWMAVYGYTDVLRQQDPNSVPDNEGPEVTNPGITPDPGIKPFDVLVSATIDDTDCGFHNIQAAEWCEGATPSWPGIQMTAADGSFNSPLESVEYIIDTNGWSLGNYTIWIRGQDNQGNWGNAASINLDLRAGSNLPPWINITSPNGSEVWMGGNSQMITWNMGDFPNPITDLVVDLEYSSTGLGGPWNPIATVVGVTSYCWNPVPLINSTNNYIRATVTDIIGWVRVDESDGSFEIDSIPPEPSHNARAELEGNGVRIFWDASVSIDIDHYEVHWSMNVWNPSGDDYINTINAGLNTDCFHATVGVNNPQTYYYQVRTYDHAGHEVRAAIQAVKIGSTQSIFANPSGWFLMGLSLEVSNNSVEYLLKGQGLPTNCDHVMLYRGGQWLHWASYWSSELNTLKYILSGESFWMHVTGNTRWAVAGRVLDYVVPLDTGWTLVANPFAERFKTSGEIMSHLAANCPDYDQMMIADYTQTYRVAIPTGTETVYDYQGFWVHVTADTAWTVINY